MKSAAFAFALFILPTLAWSQEGGERPVPSAVRDSRYPLYNLEDGSVTFRVRAPDAEQVQMVPMGDGNGLASGPVEMTKDDEGNWTGTVEDPEPGFHYYQISVDGFQCNDPNSKTYFGWNRECSGVDVPDPNVDFYTERDVPHGEVRICYYPADTTGTLRRVFVYTPPGYDDESDRRYPVLYLQHGAGENETSWYNQGLANVIMDNLIAEGKAVPMLVVMEQGYARKPGEEEQGDRRRRSNAFEELVVKDLVPFIDDEFRTTADRSHRAIAGLSMGGGQAMRIGLGNLDVFANIGALSGAMRNFSTDSFDGALKDADAANERIDLLWVGCGTSDFLYESIQEAHKKLNEQGIEHVYFETTEGHEWQAWRKSLHDLAPRLFQGSDSAAQADSNS